MVVSLHHQIWPNLESWFCMHELFDLDCPCDLLHCSLCIGEKWSEPFRVGVVCKDPVYLWRARYSKLSISTALLLSHPSLWSRVSQQHDWHFRAHNYLLLEATLYPAWNLIVCLAQPRDSFQLYNAPTLVSKKIKKKKDSDHISNKITPNLQIGNHI